VKADRPYKSLSAEDTFFEDLLAEADLVAELDRISRTVWDRLQAKSLCGRTVNLKVKYQDFRIVTRARSVPRAVGSQAELLELGIGLLRGLLPADKGIRLLGIGLSNLSESAGAGAVEREPALPL
jgi:DNA polymerase-4